MEAPLSRVEAILQNILGADNVLVPPQSRVEAILLAILNNTEYIHPGDPSRVEEILLAIKDGGSYNKKALSRVEDILIHKLNDEEYTDYSEDDLSRVEKLLIQWIDLHPEVIKELTTSSFPISILANGLPLLDYRIDGNSVQSGTPTPDNPIEPEFCGDLVSIELDEPLRAVDSENYDTIDLATKTYTKRITDEIILTGEEDWNKGGVMAPIVFYCAPSGMPYREPNTQCVGTLDSVITYDGRYSGYRTYKVQLVFRGGDISYTVDDLKAYLREKYQSRNPIKVCYCVQSGYETTQTLSSIPDGLTGVIEGTVTQSGTPTHDNPIEPVFKGTLLPNGKYQVYKTYKLPISSGGVTKNIYLGQVQSTRKIKKLVLTGEETIQAYSPTTRYVINIPVSVAPVSGSMIGLCTHYFYDSAVFTTNGSFIIDLKSIYWYRKIPITDNRFTTADDFKSYLAAQYAAGTPVTIWYVLATPEVGIVNEPLARIGDYADSVDFSQAGVEIPTLKKPNTTVIDVETEVEPSSMYLKYSEPSDGPAQKTHVLGTKDREIYVTPNNEVYVLRR